MGIGALGSFKAPPSIRAIQSSCPEPNFLLESFDGTCRNVNTTDKQLIQVSALGLEAWSGSASVTVQSKGAHRYRARCVIRWNSLRTEHHISDGQTDLQRMRGSPTHPALKAALADFRRALVSVAVFSSAANILMLAGPLYMLQVYDRVLASRSVPTLIALSVMLVISYAFQGALDFIRGRIAGRAALAVDHHHNTTVHNAVVALGLRSRIAGEALQPLRDLDQIRGFLTSSGVTAILDMPG